MPINQWHEWFIRNQLKKGVAKTAALKKIRGTRWGVRTTDFLSKWDEIAGVQQRQNRLKFINKNKAPSDRLVTEGSDAMKSRWRADVELRVQKVDDGEQIQFFQQVTKDSKPTIGEVEREAQDVIEGIIENSPTDFAGLETEVIGYTHKPGTPNK